jgi:hypothetical protein
MKKIIVCGSRDYKNKALLEEMLEKIVTPHLNFELITGDCPTGADKMAWDWFCSKSWDDWIDSDVIVESRVVAFKKFPANWKKYGRAAGPRRNAEMADYVLGEEGAGEEALCIAFWDGKSKGTKDMIDKARRHGIKVCDYITS